MDEFKINISTEDGEHFNVLLESVQKRFQPLGAGVRIHHKVFKEDGFPIQIEPFPAETDVQELIRLAVRIYQKQSKRNLEQDGKS